MSNDELQKAIDDITSGDAAASAAAADDASTTTGAPADTGTATVTLPDDMAGSGVADTNLNFTETPDPTTGASTDIFGAPPAPDISTAMPAGVEEPTTNPATEAAPSVPEPVGADPLAGFDPSSVALNTTPTAETAPAPAPAPEIGVTASAPATEIPTSDTLGAQPTVDFSAPVEVAEAVPALATDTNSVVDEAMKELYPLLDKVPSMTDKEKYDVCMKVGGEALPKALQFAKGISDETEKAEALLKIIESAK